MRVKSVFIVLGIGFLSGLAIMWAMVDKDDPSFQSVEITSTGQAAEPSLDSNVGLPQAELVSIRQEIDRLHAEIVQPGNTQIVDQQGVDEDALLNLPNDNNLNETVVVPTDGSEEVTEIYMQEQIATQVERLDEQLQYETLDPDWSYWAENEIVTNIKNSRYAGVNVVGAECRSTLCRLQFQFNDVLTRDEAVGDISKLVSWDSQGFFHADEEDPLSMVIYISREGAQLAKVE